MLEELLAGEVLEIRIVDPTLADLLIGQRKDVLEQQQTDHEPVVCGFFGRIVPSDATTESRLAIRENAKIELQASAASHPENLAIFGAGNRLPISPLGLVHGRLAIYYWNSCGRSPHYMIIFPPLIIYMLVLNDCQPLSPIQAS